MAFSCIIKCGFCGSTLTRRHWNSGKNYSKSIWHCVAATKFSKKHCPHCKGIEEAIIEKAFVDTFNLIKSNDKELLEGFIGKVEDTLNEENVIKKLEKIEKEINLLENKKLKLVDMHLDGSISKDDYDNKYQEVIIKIQSKNDELEKLKEIEDTQNEFHRKLNECRRKLESNNKLESFDRFIFESIIERVTIGGFDSSGNIDPYMITFVLKTGNNVNISPLVGRDRIRNINSVDKQYQPLMHKAQIQCLHDSLNACRVYYIVMLEIGQNYTEIVYFDLFYIISMCFSL